MKQAGDRVTSCARGNSSFLSCFPPMPLLRPPHTYVRTCPMPALAHALWSVRPRSQTQEAPNGFAELVCAAEKRGLGKQVYDNGRRRIRRLATTVVAWLTDLGVIYWMYYTCLCTVLRRLCVTSLVMRGYASWQQLKACFFAL
jgi:hypothetical protein